MKKPTMQFKLKVVREVLDGMSLADAAEKYKCTMPQVRGWRTQYKDKLDGEQPANGTPEKVTPERETRTKRVSLTEQKRLEFSNPDPDYVYRGVVEDDRRVGRVEKYKTAWWEPVPKTEGTFGTASVGHPGTPGSMIARASGLGSTTHLMRKRRELEEEDMAKVQAKVTKEEEAIFGELNKPGRFGRISLGDRTEER